jgi:hypothetical protein
MLRHRDTRTTEKYCARAMSEKAHDPDRAKLRLKPECSLPPRVEELWRIWAAKHAEAAACVTSAYGGTTSEGEPRSDESVRSSTHAFPSRLITTSKAARQLRWGDGIHRS